MEMVWTPAQIIDQSGKKVVGVMMAYAPVGDGVIDTSSRILSKPCILYDNCKSIGYIRQLGIETVHVVRTDIIGIMGDRRFGKGVYRARSKFISGALYQLMIVMLISIE
jgi:hypothetical protein